MCVCVCVKFQVLVCQRYKCIRIWAKLSLQLEAAKHKESNGGSIFKNGQLEGRGEVKHSLACHGPECIFCLRIFISMIQGIHRISLHRYMMEQYLVFFIKTTE